MGPPLNGDEVRLHPTIIGGAVSQQNSSSVVLIRIIEPYERGDGQLQVLDVIHPSNHHLDNV